MNKNDLFDYLNDIDENILSKTLESEPKVKKFTLVKKVSAIAAALAIMITAFQLIPFSSDKKGISHEFGIMAYAAEDNGYNGTTTELSENNFVFPNCNIKDMIAELNYGQESEDTGLVDEYGYNYFKEIKRYTADTDSKNQEVNLTDDMKQIVLYKESKDNSCESIKISPNRIFQCVGENIKSVEYKSEKDSLTQFNVTKELLKLLSPDKSSQLKEGAAITWNNPTLATKYYQAYDFKMSDNKKTKLNTYIDDDGHGGYVLPKDLSTLEGDTISVKVTFNDGVSVTKKIKLSWDKNGDLVSKIVK